MKILYGNLQNDGVQVYIDKNNDLFIADFQSIWKYENTQENIAKLIEVAQGLIMTWTQESK